MNPVIVQAIAAERTRELRTHAAAERRARTALRSVRDGRTSRERHAVPGLRGGLSDRGAHAG